MDSRVKPFYVDLLFIFLSICLNPIAYFLFFSPGIFPPDSFAYATMAKNLFHKGLLYLPSWGHIDTGLILPPLYPFLIAIGRFLSPETLTVAEFISGICLLIFAIPVFFIIKAMANRIIAVVAIILIQLNYYYFLIGMKPLSESLFLLTIGLTLWLVFLLLKNPSGKQRMLSFFLGLLCSLVFFSRQIGIIIYFFIGGLLLFQWVFLSGKDRRALSKNFYLVVLGALVLLIPYSLSLYLQTGHHPLIQSFKKNKHHITVSDPAILHDIKQAKTLPSELLEAIKAQDDDYGVIYAERRRMRKLLPDASEMYGYVSVDGEEKTGNIKKALSNFKDPAGYLARIFNNIIHLKSALGGFTLVLFFLLCFFPLLAIKDNIKNVRGFLLPFFVVFYILVISLITDRIARYIYIIFPFCVMHISIEAYRYLYRLRATFKKRASGFLLLALIFSLILLTTPRFFTDLDLNPKYLGMDNEYGYYFKKIVNGEPVFSLFAYEAYLVGSPYRILPNDSLEKVATYGKKTGVRWILLFHGQGSVSELQLYNNLDWYSNRLLERTYPDLVKFRLGTMDGAMALYEIL